MLKKEFTGTTCKVTFILPESLSTNAKEAYVVGTFTKWTTAPIAMTREANIFQATKELPLEQEFEFKYIVDGNWFIDWNADKYIPNPFTGDDSVVMTYAVLA